MSTWEIAVVATCCALAAAAWVVVGVKAYRAFRRRLRNRVAHEQATGHTGVRRRVQRTVGRRTDTFKDVMRAETMPGWVWFYWTRHNGEAYREHTGWALTRRQARRRLARAVERDQALRSSARR